MRHIENLGTFQRGHFTATRDRRLPKPKATPRAVRDGLAPLKASIARLGRTMDAAGTTLDGIGSNLDRIAAGLRALKDRRRAMADAAAAPPSLLTSATSGYVRDSAGNRLRPMTPADLSDAADRHYKRGVYAPGRSTPAVDAAVSEPPRSAIAVPDMQANANKFYGRAQ